MTEEEFLNKSTQATAYLVAMANKVILEESPVSANTIGIRIMEACGIAKANQKIRERIDYVVRATRVKPAPEGGTLFFWKSGDDPMAYDFYRVSPEGEVRSPEDIHPSEAACAMLEAIKEQYGIPRDAALVAGAHKLGLTRMTPSAKTLMETGMEILENENAVTLDNNGMLQVKSVL